MIKELIETTLSIPVLEGMDVQLLPKCATVVTSRLGAGLAGEGKTQERVTNHQIDLFYKQVTAADIYSAAETLVDAIEGACTCSIPTVDYSYDRANHYWRAMINFELSEV